MKQKIEALSFAFNEGLIFGKSHLPESKQMLKKALKKAIEEGLEIIAKKQCPECNQNKNSGMNFCAFCGREL
jgi:hypothetical protein